MKRKRMTPEERAEFEARMARLEARERQLRQLVEAGVADMKRRAAEGHPYRRPPGYPDTFGLQ
jgi:hypothetical protein